MARLFDDGSSQYLEYGGAVLSSTPFTMACWFNSDDATAGQVLMAISDDAAFHDLYWLAIRGDATGDPVRAYTQNGASYPYAETSSGYSANVWHHACGVWAASDDRRVYIDGGSKGTDATDETPDSLDTTTIGCRHSNSTTSYHMSGAIAHAAIWNVALSDDEVASLAAGAHPLTIRPESIVAYWPLVRTDQDVVGGYDMTATNNPTWTDQPGKVFGPAPVFVGVPAAAAPSARRIFITHW